MEDGDEDVVHISELKPDPENARLHTPRNVGMIADALQEVGAARSIVIDEDNTVLAGNATVEAAGQVDMTRVRVVEASGNEIIAVRRRGLSEEQKKRLALFDNRTAELANWDLDVLQNLNADGLLAKMWNDEEIKVLMDAVADQFGGNGQEDGQTLSERFGVPPFSVLDARQGYWQDRKRAWIDLGIRSELGRGGNALGFSEQATIGVGGRPPPPKSYQNKKFEASKAIKSQDDLVKFQKTKKRG